MPSDKLDDILFLVFCSWYTQFLGDVEICLLDVLHCACKHLKDRAVWVFESGSVGQFQNDLRLANPSQTNYRNSRIVFLKQLSLEFMYMGTTADEVWVPMQWDRPAIFGRNR